MAEIISLALLSNGMTIDDDADILEKELEEED
jgi:hypothetical protein